MNVDIYCHNGHLLRPEDIRVGKPCHQCAAKDMEQVQVLIQEIEDILDCRRTGGIREKLRLLREILWIEDEL